MSRCPAISNEQMVDSVELDTLGEKIVESGEILVESDMVTSSGDIIEIAAVTR